MRSLLALKKNVPSYVLTRDFQFVLDWCMFQCKKIFEVDLRFVDELSANSICDYDYVLLMGGENLLFGEHSLRIMQEAADSHCCAIVPTPLDCLDLTGYVPINTLKWYETVEKLECNQALARERPALSMLPISFWPAEIFRSYAEKAPCDFSTNGQEVEVELKGAGIYHKFFDPLFCAQEAMLEFIPKGVKSVLEVGCGSGSTGKLIEERLGAQVTGIEKNPHLADIARENLSHVLVGDVEKLDIEGEFDFVYATDILEHLFEPDKFLVKMRGSLAKGGSMLMTVPNIGHFTVVESLLSGRWDYVPGAINYEHYRFFTAKTLRDWFSMCGFSTVELYPQKTALPDRIEALSGIVDTDLESLSTYKFYCVVKRD